MSEQRIKLFSTMSDRYPEPGDADVVHAAARSLVSLIPGLGSPINEILSLVVVPSVARRRDEWFQDLADLVEEMQERVDDFDIKNLADNEAFVSAVVQTTRIAAGTHKKEKRVLLRNALLNIALGTGPDDDTQQIFLNMVDTFTASHVRVLDVLWRGASKMTAIFWEQNRIPITSRNYEAAIGVLIPELKGQAQLAEYILTELRSRGLTQLNGLNQTFPQGGTITNMGVQFMRFVLHPDDLA